MTSSISCSEMPTIEAPQLDLISVMIRGSGSFAVLHDRRRPGAREHGPCLMLVHGTLADQARWRVMLPYLEPRFTVQEDGRVEAPTERPCPIVGWTSVIRRSLDCRDR